ncbi:MAG: hypothetical protein WBO44_05035 [Saprospiraceae bacterium]
MFYPTIEKCTYNQWPYKPIFIDLHKNKYLNSIHTDNLLQDETTLMHYKFNGEENIQAIQSGA